MIIIIKTATLAILMTTIKRAAVIIIDYNTKNCSTKAITRQLADLPPCVLSHSENAKILSFTAFWLLRAILAGKGS